MANKRTSDYLKRASQIRDDMTRAELEREEDISIALDELRAQEQKRKKRRDTLIGVIAVLTIFLVSGVFYYATSKGLISPIKIGSIAENSSLDEQDQQKKFSHGPYEEVDLSQEHKALPQHIYKDDSLLVLNKDSFLSVGYEPRLVSVPFENQQASYPTAQAYKQLNILVNQNFGKPIDLAHAYIDPLSELGFETQNVDNTAGLALDVKVPGYKIENILNSETGQYIARIAPDLGLIIRYPEGKQEITGEDAYNYKLRFVGYPHSKILSERNLVLDEYPQFLESEGELTYEGYLISRQKGPKLKIPKDALSVHISSDNLGYYIVTSRISADEHDFETAKLLSELD
ncbi:MAG: hypothetical protein Q4E22_05605 [Coriobacteriia bacterium]|nr:hypothetical protein [Coriobacteriia bacterium]